MDADFNIRRYGKSIDPRSAHEILRERIAANLKKSQREENKKTISKAKPRRSNRQSTSEAFFKSMARSLGTAIGGSSGRKFLRGLLGSLLK
jgi:hypothetical protein